MALTVSEHAPVSDANVFTTNDKVSISSDEPLNSSVIVSELNPMT